MSLVESIYDEPKGYHVDIPNDYEFLATFCAFWVEYEYDQNMKYIGSDLIGVCGIGITIASIFRRSANVCVTLLRGDISFSFLLGEEGM